ncbi:choline ABC transporter ATP-binding protein [Cohaesibacter sp. CAU 1516]|uniref:choline ABC transporter ATP-binding protein n=1 Tax=Cohaesibacter sp. CAU 1516 TaxID=2576038 RepID=UPI0010FE5D16|nr:choline ABC transporter ATP-binding protein [Cohaesibacter sp. CAU 1516]TLP48111.1 choline ABC transporter ATP-binding protein [Cohaesibacter sp. CAU 1516]
MTPAIKFDNVSIVFGDHPEQALPLMDEGLDRNSIQEQTDQVMGVHDCSFEVHQGEIFVLMGLSGSGKSTLLRAVNGLNPVVRGAVHVDDGGSIINVTAASPRELRHIRSNRIAMVFQQFGLLPWRSVVENVALGLELSGIPKKQRREKAIEQLALVGLEDWADSQVAELSGGMQQRVGLARAFATDAPILLMDEPFSALDPLIRNRLQDELLDLQETLKRTILFVSHDLDEAFKLGNRIAILEGGHIAQIGTPREIFSRPADNYVSDFVAHMNPLAILRASDAMKKPQAESYEETVPAETLLADMLDTLANNDNPIGVVKHGNIVGELTATKVLRFLAGHLSDEG